MEQVLLTELSQIRDLEPLGQGVSGRVYRGTAPDGTRVVVKVFEGISVSREVLALGVERLERTGWPEGVMREVLADYRAKPAWRVMPWVGQEGEEGSAPGSLQHRLAEFPGGKSWPVVLGILEALAAMHRARVVHGNLKPGNVYLGEEGRVVLADWGLGRQPGVTHLDYTDAFLYQGPDQLRDPEGRWHERGYGWDVHAFGVLAFRLLTGKFPRCEGTFSQVAPGPGKTRIEGIAADLERIAKSLESAPRMEWPDAPANRLEEEYRKVLDECLELDPAKRPADALAVQAMFRAAEERVKEEQRREFLVEDRQRQKRAAWRGRVVACLLGAAVVVLSALWQLGRRQTDVVEQDFRNRLKEMEKKVVKLEKEREEAVEREKEARREYERERDVWMSRIEASREVGDHLFAWAMEKGHRRLPPLDGRELRLARLDRYFVDFLERAEGKEELKEEAALARLQRAEVALARGSAKEGEALLAEAMKSAALLPEGDDLALRLATDRLWLALLRQQNGEEGVEQAFQEARKALTDLSERGGGPSDRVKQLLAVLDFHESKTLAAGGHDGEALEKLLGATQVLNRLVSEHPDVVVLRSELVSCYLSSATILDGIGQMGDAREVRALAAEELLRMIEANPKDSELRLELAGCYGGMAEAAMLSGDVAGAESMSKGASQILEKLLAQQPDRGDVRSLLAAQRGLMAGLMRDRGQEKEATLLIDEGIRLVEGVAVGERSSDLARYRLAILWWQKGRMVGQEGDRSDELSWHRRSVDLLKKLEESEFGLEQGETVKRTLGYVLGDLGHAAQLSGKRDEAQSSFREAVVLWEELKRERPGSEEYEECLDWSRQRLTEVR